MDLNFLLKQRWKVIADYPGSDYHIGEILDRDWGWVGNDEIGFKHRISDYPNLFKKLEWWEERKPEEMPKYVKCIKGGFKGRILKISAVNLKTSGSFYEPATEEEYDKYLINKCL